MFLLTTFCKISGEILTSQGWQQTPFKLPFNIAEHCMVRVNSTTFLLIGGAQKDPFIRTNFNSSKTFFVNMDSGNWIKGPELKIGRSGHVCATIRQDGKFSIIVAGGYNNMFGFYLSSVEVLDEGATEWRKGPELPVKLYGAAIVEDVKRGLILIGGKSGEEEYLDALYQLKDTQSDWLKLQQKLKNGRAFATAVLVPDKITNCT